MRRARAIVARLPRPTHPALVAATALVVLVGVAALALILSTDWYGSCTIDGSYRDGIDCPSDLLTDDGGLAGWLGFPWLSAIVFWACAWLGAWLFWIFARWLHHRPGPRGLPPTDPGWRRPR